MLFSLSFTSYINKFYCIWMKTEKIRHSLHAASQNSKNLYDGVSNACAIRSKVVNEIRLYIPAASIWPIFVNGV